MKQTFGQALRELRRAKGISQRQLAAKTGMDFSYISKIENDRLSPPSADTVVKISDALEISPDQLLALTGKIPSEVVSTIGSSPAAIEFIRNAQAMRLSEDEWRKLYQELKRLRS
jgi:transcriptional regulator with XRE-family HTH domain